MKRFHMRRHLAALAAACLLCAQAGAVSDGAEAAFQTETRTIAAAENGADPFLNYLEHLAGLDAELLSVRGGDALTGCNRVLYDYVAAEAEKLAAGGRDGGDPLSTTFTTTLTMETAAGEKAQDAVNRQLDLGTVVDALYADYPYTFFWHGLNYGGSGSVRSSSDGVLIVTYSLLIQAAAAYQGADEYHIRAGLTGLAETTVKNAKEIVTKNAWKSDYGKLAAYRDAVCGLVEYNETATDSSTPYGDPWQIIWVFDKDPATNVVCEGYAKAFKFLCDLSSFRDPNFGCLLISGYMQGATGAGSHMWNHVYLGGKTCLVDITNSDGNAVGAAGGLFLDAPLSSDYTTLKTGYRFRIVREGYQTAEIFYSPYTSNQAIFPEQYLTLDEEGYTPPEEIEDPESPVSIEVSGHVVFVTVADNQYGFQTVWAATYAEGGQLLGVYEMELYNGGLAYLGVDLTGAVQLQAFVLESGTLRPLYEAVSKSLAE
ncbi:MAG: hypothetical protein IJT94_18295 [Oscillibacter sp.]|nr:hypothetical protein [Oscillibacter sp.]